MEYEPIERTDEITQLIKNYNLKDAGDERSIQEVIDDWKHDCDTGVYEDDEEQMVQGLYEDFQNEWNMDNDRAYNLLEEHCSIDIITAIEDWYEYTEWNFGDYLHKKKLMAKLDICYYFQAEEEFKKMLEWEEFDLDYWG